MVLPIEDLQSLASQYCCAATYTRRNRPDPMRRSRAAHDLGNRGFPGLSSPDRKPSLAPPARRDWPAIFWRDRRRRSNRPGNSQLSGRGLGPCWTRLAGAGSDCIKPHECNSLKGWGFAWRWTVYPGLCPRCPTIPLLTSPHERPDAPRCRLTPLVEIGLARRFRMGEVYRWYQQNKIANGPYKPVKPGKPGRMPHLMRTAFVPDP